MTDRLCSFLYKQKKKKKKRFSLLERWLRGLRAHAAEDLNLVASTQFGRQMIMTHNSCSRGFKPLSSCLQFSICRHISTHTGTHTHTFLKIEWWLIVGLQRWLSGYQFLLFSQRTRVQFPASISGSLQLSLIPAQYPLPKPSSGLHGYLYTCACVHMCAVHTERHRYIHIGKKKNIKKFGL